MKKTLMLLLIAILALSLFGCSDKNTNVSNFKSTFEPKDTVVMLIEQGNQLAQLGEKEAARLVFERASVLLEERMIEADGLLPDYSKLLSDKSEEFAACLFAVEAIRDSSEAIPKIDFNWGDK